jgi:thermitase
MLSKKARTLLVGTAMAVMLMSSAPGAWAQPGTQAGSPASPPGTLPQPTELEKKPLPVKPEAAVSGDSSKIVAQKNAKGELYVSGELIVTYDADATAAEEEQIRKQVEATVADDLPSIEADVLSFPELKDERAKQAHQEALEQKKQTLKRNPDVESVSYNYLRDPSFTPNDPHFTSGQQWHLNKIRTTGAWDRASGYGARVAVLDTGFDTTHPDLRGRIIWQYDFFSGDSVANVDYGYGASGHGTHVAGTVSAATNNGIGVAGVAPRAEILAAKVCGPSWVGDTKYDVNGYDIKCPDRAVLNALNYFAQNASYSAIKVANLSLGGYGYSSAYETAVNQAWNSGIVVVAAAGNDNVSNAHYPAAFPRAIAVTATDHLDRKAYYSNYGGYVDVAAPGGDVRVSGGGVLSTTPGNNYRYMQGTSMAAPHVSGLAALLGSQGLNKDWIRYRIEATTTDLGTAGKDASFGYGRINAQAAVTW